MGSVLRVPSDVLHAPGAGTSGLPLVPLTANEASQCYLELTSINLRLNFRQTMLKSSSGWVSKHCLIFSQPTKTGDWEGAGEKSNKDA